MSAPRPSAASEPPQKHDAKPGNLFVCGACGKFSDNRFWPRFRGSRSWDESCMSNSVEVTESSIRWNDTQTQVLAAEAAPRETPT